jgi:hypothetical protein
LIPYIDFINFSNPADEMTNTGSMEFDAVKKGYFVKATRFIRQGEQILMGRPFRNSYNCLIRYGICFENFANDTIPIKLRLLPGDAEAQAKKEEWLGMGEQQNFELTFSFGHNLGDVSIL